MQISYSQYSKYVKFYFMKIITALLLLCVSSIAVAQYNITGRVIETGSETPIDFANVVIFKNGTGDLITGTTTEIGGLFEIEIAADDVYLEISFLGYTTRKINDITFENGKAQLGNITLNTDAEVLEEVVVVGDRSTTEFRLDKRIFNVGSDLSSTGVSALELLNNVPSVNVDIEGEIYLRGATGVQILINGKPSVLADQGSNALGTITADMIESIEVITNPSAKYEAQGTSGIINIILKKNEKKGVNGSISINGGVPDNHSIGLSINNRTEKFNLFSQLGVGYRSIPTDTENINRDNTDGDEIRSIGEEFRNELFYNAVLGTDYYFDPLNIITLSGSFSYEVEDQPSETVFNSFENDVLNSTWMRSEVTSATNPKLQYELNYKREFKDNKDHQLLFSAVGNYFGKDQSSEFSNDFTLGTATQGDQRTATNFSEGKFTFILDYTKPFNDAFTFETGMQYLINDVSNDFEVSNQSDNGDFIIDPGLTNVFEYSQDVLGVYGTGAYEEGPWGIKVGLRVENTDLNTLLVNTNEENSQRFTNLFPSLHTSYKISEGFSLQGGYSRRIFRPRLWDLNPFFNIRNNFNIRAGNPDLLPEFTDSYEVGGILIFGQTSLNASVYHRYTTDKIDRISFFSDGVTTWIPQNIGTNKATGLEVNFKHSPTNKLTLSGDANYNIFVREGMFSDQSFDFSADQWSGKLITKYKVSKPLEVELTTRYESREQTIQGIRADNLFADFGLRYKILQGKGSFSLGVRDIFASRIRQTTIDSEDFFTFTRSQRGRFVTLGFSYGFGKGEAMEYSGNRRR